MGQDEIHPSNCFLAKRAKVFLLPFYGCVRKTLGSYGT